MKLFLSPHSDDATLFGAYTIMREKPLVITITHSTLQGDNGYDRIMEDYKAMHILGAPICFLGILEDKLTEELLYEKLSYFYTKDTVWIPEYEGGNPQHDMVNKVASLLFPSVKLYKTYTGLLDRTVGIEVIPTETELETKKLAMQCYKTQIENHNTAHYFKNYKEYV